MQKVVHFFKVLVESVVFLFFAIFLLGFAITIEWTQKDPCEGNWAYKLYNNLSSFFRKWKAD